LLSPTKGKGPFSATSSPTIIMSEMTSSLAAFTLLLIFGPRLIFFPAWFTSKWIVRLHSGPSSVIPMSKYGMKQFLRRAFNFWCEQEPTTYRQACIRSISRTSANPAQPSAQNPHFNYVPLDILSGDICLFSLFPADNSDGEIAGGLFPASLDSLPPFKAASYVVRTTFPCL
jgi:hypothetical protein